MALSPSRASPSPFPGFLAHPSFSPLPTEGGGSGGAAYSPAAYSPESGIVSALERLSVTTPSKALSVLCSTPRKMPRSVASFLRQVLHFHHDEREELAHFIAEGAPSWCRQEFDSPLTARGVHFESSDKRRALTLFYTQERLFIPSSRPIREVGEGEELGHYKEVSQAIDYDSGDLLAYQKFKTARVVDSMVFNIESEVAGIFAMAGAEGVVETYGVAVERDGERFIQAHIFQPLYENDMFGFIKEREGCCSRDLLLSITCQMFVAVCSMHERGRVNRDIKVENFLVRGCESEEPEVVAADFGGMIRAGEVVRYAMFTRGYSAPEVENAIECARDEAALLRELQEVTGPHNDVWSLAKAVSEVWKYGANKSELARGNETYAPLMRHVLRPMMQKEWKERPTVMKALEVFEDLFFPKSGSEVGASSVDES